MNQVSFWNLLDRIEPKIGVQRKRKRGATPNGSVCNGTRLAIAIRYFAGGDPLDLAVVFKVTGCLVYSTIWKVVDAINHTTH